MTDEYFSSEDGTLEDSGHHRTGRDGDQAILRVVPRGYWMSAERSPWSKTHLTETQKKGRGHFSMHGRRAEGRHKNQ